jgi:lysozyme family protein
MKLSTAFVDKGGRMNVDQLIDEIIKIEGGYVIHPIDKGGPTNMGITLATLSAWRGHRQLSADVQRLTKAEAKDIYESEYYVRPGISKLPELIQPVAFDMAVNMGPKQAIKIIQKACTLLGRQVKMDGKMGPMTVLAAQSVCDTPKAVLRAITDTRKEFYQKLVDDDPKQGVFLAGWMNRADKFSEVA